MQLHRKWHWPKWLDIVEESVLCPTKIIETLAKCHIFGWFYSIESLQCLISLCFPFQFRRLAMLRIICTTSARSMKMANFGKWLRMSQRGIRTEHPHTFILIVESVVCWLVTDLEFKNCVVERERVSGEKPEKRIWESERGSEEDLRRKSWG